MQKKQLKVLSGMRPTGPLHLGHYQGVLKNWLKLQNQYQCFFFIADWHALTTHSADQLNLKQSSIEMMRDFLSVGMNPDQATFFIQSEIKEHAELALLLSMITPLSWLERVPSYKDLQQKLTERNLLNVGFLYYPLLQTADILAYQANLVPVGEDQVAHIELSREIARRFNDSFGKKSNHQDLVSQAIKKLSLENIKKFKQLRTQYLQEGNNDCLIEAQAMVSQAANLTEIDQQILFGYLENQGQMILSQPQAMLTETCKLPGLDGQKMSKSYNNTIFLKESSNQVEKKIKRMQTDPARVRREDKGDPKKCPVFDFHQVYSTQEVQDWASKGCKTASIGCLQCKSPLIDSINDQLTGFKNNRLAFEDDQQIVAILKKGASKARDEANKTLSAVKSAMQLID